MLIVQNEKIYYQQGPFELIGGNEFIRSLMQRSHGLEEENKKPKRVVEYLSMTLGEMELSAKYDAGAR